MNADLEILNYMFESSKMVTASIKEILKLLEEKKNLSKSNLMNSLKEYENYNKEIKKLIEKNKDKAKNVKITTKITSKLGIKKEIKNDNSDAAISHMIIEGLTIVIVDMETNINKYSKELDKKTLKLSKEYFEFNKKQVEIYKEYL